MRDIGGHFVLGWP